MVQNERSTIFKGTSASLDGQKGSLILSAGGVSFIPDQGGKGIQIPLERIYAASIEGRILKKLCIVDNSGKRTMFSVPDMDQWKSVLEMAIHIYDALITKVQPVTQKKSQAATPPVSPAVTPPPTPNPVIIPAAAPPPISGSTRGSGITQTVTRIIQKVPPVYNGQWPSGQDYEQSFQTLKLNLSPSLGKTDGWEAVRNPKNPSWYVHASGNYGSIYRISTGDGKFYALKCFTKKSLSINQRYSSISSYLNGLPDSPECLTHFVYYPEGIKTRKVNGVYFPMLKMEWIDGKTLNQFISAHINESRVLKATGNRIVEAAMALQAAGIAHGDLSGDNIIIDEKGKIRFVDYDGMFIPAFSGEKATELGHADFQHPKRNAQTYSEKLDTFSVVVIQLAMQAMAVKPELWKKFNADDPDCLILRKPDYLKPSESAVISELRKTRSRNIKKLIDLLLDYLSRDPLWDGFSLDQIII
ncbi:MAG: hypothetical protein QXN26_01470 [Thermoplasmataceae archaeon]